MNCKEHKRYKGVRKPTKNCLWCWWIYFFGDFGHENEYKAWQRLGGVYDYDQVY